MISQCRVVSIALTFLLLTISPARAQPPLTLQEKLLDVVVRSDIGASESAILIRDLSTGTDILAIDVYRPMVPASTAKVLTSAAALGVLGPSFRFQTTFTTDGDIGADGRLDGNMFVVGGGDPTLVVEKLWKMVVDLRLAGVQVVVGDVVFDDTLFDDDTALSGWEKPEDVDKGPAYFPKLSALSVNFNTAVLVILPATRVGDPASMTLETPADGVVQQKSTVTTSSSGRRRQFTVDRVVEGTGMTLSVSGRIPIGSGPVRLYRTVPDPTTHFIAVFKGLLAQQGIEVEGQFRVGESPSESNPLVSLRSPTLGAVMMDMNKYSSNFIAEMVLRVMGAHDNEAAGNTALGLAHVADYLRSINISEDDYVLVNGSGLSRDTQFSANQFILVLQDMDGNPRGGAEFIASLSIGSGDGTLRRRFGDSPGVVRGKTGTLDGVHGLVGYIADDSDHRAAVAFIANGLTQGSRAARELHDELIDTVLTHWHDETHVTE